MKKLISLCLAILLTLSVMPFGIMASAEEGLYLTTYQIAKDLENNTVTVGIKAEKNTGIRGLWITVGYDAEKVEVTEAVKENLYPVEDEVQDVGTISRYTKNPFEIMWAYVTDENTAYVGDIAQITFKFKDEISCQTALNLDLEVYEAFDAEKNEISSTAIDGEFSQLGDHNYNSVVTAPTCTEAGYTTYTCTCGDSYVDDEVDALGHSYEAVVTAPTCTEGGYTTYTCANCGNSYVADQTEATGHTFDDWKIIADATCEAEGLKTRECGCGATETEVIPALGHNYEAVVTAPTCTEGGYTTYTCGNCGNSYVSDETDALGHSFGDWETVTNATCEADGSKIRECACGVTETEVIPAIGHSYEAVVTEPTCTEGGYTTYTCANCGNSYVADETEALGHSFDDWKIVTNATCEAEGLKTRECGCGATETETIPVIGHNYEAVVTAPTCTEAGYTTYTCANCGDSYVADETEALGHSFGDWEIVTNATCEADGSKIRECACGVTETEVIPAIGHNYEAVVTDPTCTEGGYTTYTCANCGNSYVSDETDALGHSLGDWETVTNATCEADGSKIRECACGVTETEVIPAIGHNYEAVVTDPTCTEAGYTTYTCANCGDSYVADETEALGHNYNSVVTEPTATEQGYTTHTCENCGDSYVDSYVDAVEIGDVDNDGLINLNDLISLAQYVAEWDVEYYKAAMDVTKDGEVNLNDVVYLAKHLAGWKDYTL